MIFPTSVNSKVYSIIEKFLLNLLRYLRSKRSISRTVKQKPKSLTMFSRSNKELDEVSIVITTFENRFFEYTIPLVTALRSEIDIPIFIVINGNYLKQKNNLPLKQFISELSKFINVYPIAFSNFHGCAELWNTGIVNADSECTFVFNDDIHIYPKLFKNEIMQIKNLAIQKGLVTINRSFSHFAISHKCIEEIGFFDEHFIGIGEEDRDYFYRYESNYLIPPYNFISEAFFNYGDESRDNNVEKNAEGKYSRFNDNIHKQFYQFDPSENFKGRYEYPMKRIKVFLNPRPLWQFRKANYEKLQTNE